ncbi:MAG: hypothetical protein ACR2PY_07415 [Salinispira sp.]
MTIYHMLWERVPIDFSNEDWLEKCSMELDQGYDYGIYQMYGDHPVYGDDVLLYIGKARDQQFKNRLKQHRQDSNNITRYTRIHVGRLAEVDAGTYEAWGDAIDDIEGLLIESHRPALNKQNTSPPQAPDNPEEHFTVLNWDEYGSLSAEVSTLRFTDYYENEDEFAFELLSEDE